VSRTVLRGLIGSAAVAMLAAGGGVAMLAPTASAATTMSGTTTTVSAQCQTDMIDLVGLATNMEVDFQNNNINEMRLNSAASAEFDSAVDCASFVSEADDNSLNSATIDVPAGFSLVDSGDAQDIAQGNQEIQQAIILTEGVQSDLGLPVGGSVPQATPPNPDIPQACVTDLETWSGDVNNMITAAENMDLTTMQSNLAAVETFPAPTDCAPVLTSDQETQLTAAGNDFVTAVQQASTTTTPTTNIAEQGKKPGPGTGGDFADAATTLSNAKTIIFNVQTAIGFFIGI
jgi:hypothetical protein